jgi:hypothetical protein
MSRLLIWRRFFQKDHADIAIDDKNAVAGHLRLSNRYLGELWAS